VICFVDTETSDLNPRTAHLLEVGIVFTDDDLTELAAMSTVLRPVGVDVAKVITDPVVIAMHEKNGLRAEVEASTLHRYEAELLLVNFAVKFTGHTLANIPLAGSSVGFDRAWLEEHMPTFHGLFHRRSIDVSGVTELAKRWAPKVYEGRPKKAVAHRALDDARESIEYLRFYRETGFLGSVRY
jgi:oligoribonuclease